MSDERAADAVLSRALLILAIACGGGLRLWLAFRDQGMTWPDEIFQTLEPAHRLAFGYGLRTWELVVGARSWTLPGLLALGFRLLAPLTGDDPRHMVPLLHAGFVAVELVTALGAARLARAFNARGWIAATVYLGLAPAIFFGHRALSEVAAAPPAAWGLALSFEREASSRRRVLSGLLLALACALRLQLALFAVAALAGVVARRDRRATLQLGLSLVAGALALGLLDRLTWGGWFHSALTYLHENAVKGVATTFGAAPASFYARTLFATTGWAAIPLGLLALVGAARALELALVLAAFVVPHAIEPHKELRFLLPALPLVAVLVELGVGALGRGVRTRVALVALVGVALACSIARVPRITFGELGSGIFAGAVPAKDALGPLNRLLWAAHDRADLCGLVVPYDLTDSGGYTYLHRPVPMYPQNGRWPGHANYAIGSSSGLVVATDGNVTLRRIANGCEPDPSYPWRAN